MGWEGGVVVRDFSCGAKGMARVEGRRRRRRAAGPRVQGVCATARRRPPSPNPSRRRRASAHARRGPRLHPACPLAAAGSLATCTQRLSPSAAAAAAATTTTITRPALPSPPGSLLSGPANDVTLDGSSAEFGGFMGKWIGFLMGGG